MNNKMVCISIIVFLLLLTSSALAEDNWDNQLYFSNRINGMKNNWRLSGDLQFRLNNDLQNLQSWYLEFAPSYMPHEKWEIVPDYRITVKPTLIEHRAGFGILRKDTFGNKDKILNQFVNKIKYQADFNSDYFKNGVRYELFYTMIIKKKIIPNLGGGVYHSWSDNFTGVEFIRVGGGLGYALDQIHFINFMYFFGVKNNGIKQTYEGITMLQLVFNINRNYKFIPARYITF
jgi:hypothetical protein